MSKSAGVVLALASLLLFACGHATEKKGTSAAKTEQTKTTEHSNTMGTMSAQNGSTMKTAMKGLPAGANKVCPVSGDPVDPTLSFEYQGKKIYLCCPKCLPKIKADPAKYFAKAYPQLAKAGTAK